MKKLKKPYLKKFCNLNKIVVWIVDGQYIREEIDEEFTNFGQHYAFSYIPINEFWIDKENCPGEEHYFIEHMLVENRLMAEGKSYNFARSKGKLAEKKERFKSKLMKEVIRLIKSKKMTVRKIHKKLLHKTNSVSIWLVNGELVRGLFFTDFTEGGHDKVYPYIPKGEVWIDDDVTPDERNFVLLHALHERNLMAKNGGDYLPAHSSASKIEYYCRHHKNMLNKKIKEELRKAEKG
jgi:hypothetical protein